jgi:hypothetical protein
MGRFLVAAFSCGAWREVFGGAAGSTGRFCGLLGGHEAPGAIPCQSDIWGVGLPPAGSNRRQGRVKFAMRLVKAQPAETARGRSGSARNENLSQTNST